MTTDVAEPEVAVARRPRVWKIWAGAVGAVLAAAALVAWLVVGLTPDVVSGYVFGSDDPAAQYESGDVTGQDLGRGWFVDRRTGSFTTVVRNEGPLEVTLSVPADQLPFFVAEVTFARYLTAYVEVGPALDVITLRPGEEAQVRVGLDLGCATNQGGGVWIDAVDVTATTLGLSRTVPLDAGGSWGFWSKTGTFPDPSDDCPLAY